MTPQEALEFVRKHGVVLESARGPVPCLAHAIAGEAIGGSWWGHARGQEIFELSRAVRDCDDVLVCRLVHGKITYVHRRLWPALVRLAGRFPGRSLARVRETHSRAGRHVTTEVPHPAWVPADVVAEAARLSEAEAARTLGPWCRA